MQQQHSITVTINQPTAGQLLALNDILEGTADRAETKEAAPKTKRGRPAKTVSDEEEETFGKKPLKAKDLEEETEEAESEEETESEEEEEIEEESDDTQTEMSFDEVKKVINKYGERKPEDMKAILAGFGLKSTKELERNPKKWEAVYNKVQAKLTAKKVK